MIAFRRFVKSNVLVIAIVIALLSLACSKKQEDAKVSSKPRADIAGELSKSQLTKHIPENISGFFYWNTSHASYQRLTNSAWAKSSYVSLEDMLSENTTLQNALKNAGLASETRKDWEQIFQEAVVFAAPAAANVNEPGLGVVFRSASEIKIGDRLAKFKNELNAASITAQDLEIKGGKGFSFDAAKFDSATDPITGEATPPTPHLLYIGWNNDLAAIASAKGLVDSALGGSSDNLPKLIASAEFKARTAGFPDDKTRYGIGYIDLATLLKSIQASFPESSQNQAVQLAASNQFPFKALSWSLAMDEAPYNDVKVAYEPVDELQKKWFQALNGSPSENLLNVLPPKPLVFISLDGATIKQAKELALSSAQQANMENVQKHLALFDSVKRIGILARIAPVGQSMLPVPDLTILLETPDAANASQQVVQAVSTALAASGMVGMTWQDKTISGVGAKTMMSPLGFGAFIAPAGSFVVVASSENQLAGVLAAIQGKGQALSASLAPPVRQLLAKDNSVGNVYINFEELGTFMENMGGMLSMYAPQSEEAKKLVAPENIENLKKMGSMVGSITLGEGMINFRSFYEQPEAPKKVAEAGQPKTVS